MKKQADKIITSADMGGSNRQWIDRQVKQQERGRGIKITVKSTLSKSPVYARVYRGSWIADCDKCNGAMFVDPSDPVFFCADCHNSADNGKLRPVFFPDDYAEIETALLERPKETIKNGMTYTREWLRGETVDDIRGQNTIITAAKKRGK